MSYQAPCQAHIVKSEEEKKKTKKLHQYLFLQTCIFGIHTASSLSDGPRTWCRSGETGREVDRPIDFIASRGSGTLSLSLYLEVGVDIDSIVAFSKLAMRMGGGLPRFRSGAPYRKVDRITSKVPHRNCVSSSATHTKLPDMIYATYRQIDIYVEENDTEEKADNDADASREVLGDVVCVINAERREDAAARLKHDQDPNHPVVPVEKAMLSNFLAILVNDADQ